METETENPLEAAMARIMAKAKIAMEKYQAYRLEHLPQINQASFDNHPQCPTHGGKLELNLEESVEASFRDCDIDNDTYQLVWHPCRQCEKKAEAKEIEARWLRRGIPPKCIDATLKGMIITGPEIDAVRRQVADWVMKKLQPPFLFLLGDPGRGKTHMASAVMKAHGTGWMIRHSDLLQLHRSRIDNKDAINAIEKAQQAKLLVIDEFGVALRGKDEADMFYSILSYRFENSKPTIITSNLDYRGIMDYLNFPALDSRLSSESLRIWVDGTDFRNWKEEA